MADAITLRVTLNADGTVAGAKIIRGELDKIGATAQQQGARGAEGVRQIDSAVAGLGRQAASARNLVLGLVAGFLGFQGVSSLIRGVIENTQRQEQALAQLEARVRSTGGAAGFSAAELAKMAGGLQQITTFGDEAVMEMQALLLTFTNIAGPQFTRTQQAVADMATAMGQDLKSAALQVGKALNDPVGALSSLTRSGVQFSQEQQTVIRRLAETGEMARAQSLILDELERQFGGAAAAARNTLGGALAALRNAVGDLLEGQGGLGALRDTVESVIEVVQSPSVQAGFQSLVGLIGEVVSVAVAGFGLVLEAIGLLATPIRALHDGLDEIAVFLVGAWVAAKLAATAATLKFSAALTGLPFVAVTTAVGLLVLGIYNLVTAKQALSEATENIVGELDRVSGALQINNAESVKNIAQLHAQAQAQMEVARTALEAAKAKALFEVGGFVAFNGREAFGEFKQAEADLEAISAAVDRTNEAFARAALDGIRNFFDSILTGAASTAEFENLLAQWNSKVAEAEAKLRQHTEGTAEYRRELAALIIAKALDAGQTEEQIAQLRAQLEQGAAILAQADALRTSRGAAAAAAREQAAAERERAALAREVEQATSQAQAAFVSYMETLDPLTAAELRHAEALAEIDRWHALGAISVQRYAELKAMAGQVSAQQVQALLRERDVLGAINRDHAEQVKMLGMTRRELAAYQAGQRAVAAATDDFGNVLAGVTGTLEEIEQAARNAALTQYDLRESTAEVDDILSRFGDDAGVDSLAADLRRLRAEIERLSDPMDEAFDPDRVAELERAVGRVRISIAQGMLGATAAALRGIQGMADEGSNSYRNMGIAIEALTAAQAILGIVNQSSGDPYTAFARMAAMAAIMAQFVANISGSIGGSWSDTAAQRQATQGTGSVLGDAEAKSESIANAIQITADATSALVAINRGMLRALIQMQNSIGAATGMLARGARTSEFDPLPAAGRFGDILPGALSRLPSDPLRLLGGSSRVTDQGIVIFGGALTELINDIALGAYQQVESRRWRFGSRRTNEQIVGVSEQLERQFSLIIESIATTVREGALALGMLPDEVEAALAAFRVEEIRISLQGLSAEEQQAELEAVFGQIFDGLAGSVVPWIGEFQRVGEGLGETLVRVATGVQVTQEALRRLGFSLEETDPQAFARISEGLIEMAGGLEEFIAGMMSFVDRFAPEDFKFQTLQDELTRALDQVGLSIPPTREAMWELMQSLDATTEEGREQIATLLRLSDVADEYYRALERVSQVNPAAAYLEFMADFNPARVFQSQVAQIRAQERQAIATANNLARAAGLQGAAEMDLAAIHQWAANQIAAAITELRARASDLAAQLYGPDLRDVANEVERIGNGFGSAASAVEDLFARHRAGVRSVQEYLDSMLVGDLSALTPEERLAEAWRQLTETAAAAAGGDADAMARLPQMGDLYLRLLRDFEASGADYNAGFQAVRDLLGPIANLTFPGAPGGGPVQVGPSPEYTAVYQERDAAMAEREQLNRLLLAQQLAQHLNDLAAATNTPILELADSLGFTMVQLATDLGVNLEEITGESVQALAAMATLLGVELGDLTQALGLELTDLSEGVTELTTALGIDLSNLTAESTAALAGLAQQLGTDLSTLASSVGVDLGALADSQSLLNQALSATIDGLPAAERDLLQPLLQAITEATTEADANAAIAALEEEVNRLSPAIRDRLAPYLQGVFPAAAMNQLDYLGGIYNAMTPGGDLLHNLWRAAQNLEAANANSGIPSFDVGTARVPRDMLARIHRDEIIVDPQSANVLRRYGIEVRGGASDPQVLLAIHAELAQVRQAILAADANNVRVSRETTEAVTIEARADRAAADDRLERARSTLRHVGYDH